ncbi:MAG TPA: polysaccharide biosynthesis/export family protein [Steroidobacteraceae bacterium]|nr:polysaccharide biosynthesis/export family protein [Steroidobacteraceae bacterium]
MPTDRSSSRSYALAHRAARLIIVAFMTGLLWTQTRAASEDYRLGAGDLLKIVVFDHDELNLDARVSQTGNITFALVGQVPVGGLSTREAELLLAKRLAEGGFVSQPQVSILVSDYESQKVSVMGQVTKAGQYPLDSSKSVLDALALAGGLLSDAAGDDATLVRADGTHVAIDLPRLFDGDPAMNLPVHDGDTVFVQRAAQFYVYGEVQHPGQYRLPRNTTISQAISIGGGLTPRGTQRGAIVKRLDADGKEHKLPVADQDLLQPNDVLLIKPSWF